MKLHNIPAKYQEWLNARGITDEVLFKNNISVNQVGEIVIPIYDHERAFLYNKYRRNPWSEDGPKYRYDKGASAALYNLNSHMFENDAILICEGELDAMALQSRDYYAVSTTGGAGTFKEEWVPFLHANQIYIVYDNDLAGMQGTLRLLKFIPRARVILLPASIEVKDVTEFLMRNSLENFDHLMQAALPWVLPTTKEECTTVAKDIEDRRQSMMMEGNFNDFPHVILSAITEIYDSFKAKEKKKEYRSVGDASDAIARARAVPITEYVTFSKKGDALCIAHTDKHPSMHYFKKNNKVKCFPCGFNGDTIDVVMKLFNLPAGEAIKKINT